MKPAAKRVFGRTIPRSVLLLGIVLGAHVVALIGSGFWEGGVKCSWSKGYLIGTLTHGCVSVSHWNFSHMPPTFISANKPGVHLSGNRVEPDKMRPARWFWTPNLYKSKMSIGPKVHALRVPLWMLALLPLAMSLGVFLRHKP